MTLLEQLVDPALGVPVESNAVEGGVLVAHTTYDYQPFGRDRLLRRGTVCRAAHRRQHRPDGRRDSTRERAVQTPRRSPWQSRRAALLAVSLFATVVPVSAQVETTFVHGIVSSGGTWNTAATRLSGSLAINAHQPDLPWSAPYDDQALTLDTIGLNATTIAVGHSNGGIVARRWVARGHHLDTLVTVGTPHFGAPIVANLGLYGGWFYQSLNSIFRSGDAISWLMWNRQDDPSYSCCDWQWIWYQVAESLNFGVLTVATAARSRRWVSRPACPVLGQMDPRSGYLQSINSGGELAAEAGSVPARIGIVSTASPLGGPLRLVFSDSTSDWIGGTFHGIAYAFYYLYFDMASQLDPWDYDGWDAADNLWNAALRSSTAGTSHGAPRCRRSGCGTATATTPPSHLGPRVSQRAAAPRGRPRTRPTSDNGIIDLHPGGAGRLRSRSAARWRWRWGRRHESAGRHFAVSRPDGGVSDGRFVLKYQTDGNFVLYDNGSAVWAINCWPQCNNLGAPGHAIMQEDGNLVVIRRQRQSRLAYVDLRQPGRVPRDQRRRQLEGGRTRAATSCGSDDGPLRAVIIGLAVLIGSPQLRLDWTIAVSARGTPAVDTTGVFFLSAEHEVVRASDTGTVQWRRAIAQRDADGVGARVLLLGRDVVVAGDDDVVAVNPRDGAIRWRFSPADGYGAGLSVGDARGPRRRGIARRTALCHRRGHGRAAMVAERGPCGADHGVQAVRRRRYGHRGLH